MSETCSHCGAPKTKGSAAYKCNSFVERSNKCHERQHANAEEAIAALGKEIAALKQWKLEACAVEASWDAQAVAKLLNLPLGVPIRPGIQPAVEVLKQEIATLGAKCAELEEELKKETEAANTLAAVAKSLTEQGLRSQQDLAAARARVDALEQSVAALLPYADSAGEMLYDGTQGNHIRAQAKKTAVEARKALAGEGGLAT